MNPSRKPTTRKRLADYFPEEHIIVTSGLVMLVIGLLTVMPALLSPIGFSSQVAFAPLYPSAGVPFTLVDAFLAGVGALFIVFVIVYLTAKYARLAPRRE